MEATEERITVAFTLTALERLRDPGAVFDQTRNWARSVGLVSDRPMHAQTGFARKHGIDYGFHSGPRDLLDSLPVIRGRPEHAADRYLLIGVDTDPDAARAAGWEYLTIEDAAEATGWQLVDDDADTEEDRGWP